MSGTMKAVLYAAKSTEDKHGSIGTQIADCSAMAEREGWEIVGEFQDEAFSAFSGNRGPDLERAKALAVATAAEHGRCVLVAQDADRFARGAGDAPGAADHVGEIYFAMKRRGVELWTVRSGHLDLLRAAIEGERSHGESDRKRQAVKAGKRRQAERGEHLGGPLPDGYRGEPYLDERGKQRRRIIIDPDRAPIVRDIFKLGLEGVPDAQIARQMNIDKVLTRAGNPWTRRAVQDMLTRSFYAGRIAYDGETFAGKHEALIDPGDFDRLIEARGDRDLGRGRHTVGRPAKRHALQRLAVCGRCGRTMNSITSSYQRKDGTRQRQYVCPGRFECNGTCSAPPIDAPTVDAAILAALDGLLPDFHTWIGRINERRSAEQQRLAEIRDRCLADRDNQARRAGKCEAKWAEYLDTDPEKAEIVLPMVNKEIEKLAAAETRLQAAEDALATVPTETPVDALLDFATALQEALSGISTDAGSDSMAAVNAKLAREFESFIVWRQGDTIQIKPQLLWHGQVFEIKFAGRELPPWLISEYDDPPPMRWISTAVQDPELIAGPGGRKPDRAQVSSPVSIRRALRAVPPVVVNS